MKIFIKKLIPKSILLKYHKVLALLARVVYGNPSRELAVIGVTGTDGKTSSVILISEILDAAGIVNAYMTTAEFKVADIKWVNDTKQTMPGRFKLQKLLRRAVNEKCTHAIIETSSQGIEQSRHLGIDYDIALFTNLSEDHLEAHGSFENYKKEKIKLFEKVASDPKKEGIPKVHVINLSDTEAQDFLAVSGVNKQIGITIEGDGANEGVVGKILKASNLDFSGKGLVFDVHEKTSTEDKTYHIATPLIGKFNVYNILGAIAVVRALNISIEAVKSALSNIDGIPGRLEVIDEGQDYTVIVDYAHAENALRKVFETIKPLSKGKIISVLGSCGGGRDVKKRPLLGRIAAENADIVIVTNEDPYDEDPEKIINQVSRGALDAGKKRDVSFFAISDRKEAIDLAIQKAEPGDTVLLTGKGSEQCIVDKGGKKIPWDDRKVARELINKYKIS